MFLKILKNIFKKPITIKYPKEKTSVPDGFRGLIEIDEKKCIGCGLCVRICPVGALRLENKKVKYSPDDCIFCGLCERICPMKAIKMTKKYLKVIK